MSRAARDAAVAVPRHTRWPCRYLHRRLGRWRRRHPRSTPWTLQTERPAARPGAAARDGVQTTPSGPCSNAHTRTHLKGVDEMSQFKCAQLFFNYFSLVTFDVFCALSTSPLPPRPSELSCAPLLYARRFSRSTSFSWCVPRACCLRFSVCICSEIIFHI